MTAARAIAARELRVLLPVWAASVATIVVAAFVSPGRRFFDLFMPVAFLAYTLGTAAIGALAAGQDYLFGTLSSALAQPMARRRAALIKFAVLVPLAVSLATAFLWTIHRTPSSRSFDADRIVVAGVFLSAVCLAPWLTIVTRNLLAGTLFPLAFVSLAWIAVNIVVWFGYELPPGTQSDAIRNSLFGWITAAACAGGAMLSWRALERHEAIEGPVATIDFGAWRRRDTTAPLASRPGSAGRRAWLLAMKELHLQQLSFAVAALFAAGWIVLSDFYGHRVGWRDFPLVPVVPLFFTTLSLVIGCLSSAEERHLGILEIQTLLPTTARLQWAVKTVVTFGVTALLALALPYALLNDARLGAPERALLSIGPLAGVITMTAFAMYVSSTTTSGVRAMAYSIAAGFVALWYMQWVWRMIVPLSRGRRPLYMWPPEIPWLLGMAALLVWLAFRNHRTLERGVMRIAGQVALIAAFGLVWLAAWLRLFTR